MDANKGKRRLPPHVVIRVGAVLAVEGVLVAALRWASAPVLHAGPSPTAGPGSSGAGWTLAELVVVAAAVAAWVALGLLVTSTVVMILLAACERTRVPALGLTRFTGPVWWRRALVGACGLSLAAPVAHAAPHHGHSSQPCPVACASGASRTAVLSGLGFPDLPDQEPSPAERPQLRVVRRGDSLWSIARSELPRTASDAAVCRAVEALYAANRPLIGSDPDLILPGTELSQPGGTP
jgi:hypothetical protein